MPLIVIEYKITLIRGRRAKLKSENISVLGTWVLMLLGFFIENLQLT